MEKEVILGDKKLILRSSLYSLIDYKSRFGSEFFNDIKKLENTKEENITNVIEIIFRIVFVLSNPKENETFKGFLEKLDFSILNDAALLTNLTNTIVELLKQIRKQEEVRETPFDNKYSFSSAIIFNMAKLGLSIEDTKHFDIGTYIELIEIEKELYKDETNRRANQSDIDSFFL